MATQLILSEKWVLMGEALGVNHFNRRHGDDPFSGHIGACCLIAAR